MVRPPLEDAAVARQADGSSSRRVAAAAAWFTFVWKRLRLEPSQLRNASHKTNKTKHTAALREPAPLAPKAATASSAVNIHNNGLPYRLA